MNVTVDVQDIIFLITTPLSIIGELSVLISFLRYPRQLLFGGAAYVSFIFFQVLSTFFLSSKMFASTIFMVMTRDDPSHINGSSIDADVCFALGIIDQFSYASTVCWDFMITIQILYLLYKVGGATVGGFDFEENKTYWNIFGHGTVWTLAVTSALVPAILRMYGPSLNGCYITDEHLKTILIVSLIPMMFFMITAFLVLFIALWNRSEFSRKQAYIRQVGTKEEIAQFPNFWLLVGFTCVFIFHWLPYVCLRLLEQIDIHLRETRLWEILSYIQMVSFTTQGISSAIVWWLSSISSNQDSKKKTPVTWTQPELGELINKGGSLTSEEFPNPLKNIN